MITGRKSSWLHFVGIGLVSLLCFLAGKKSILPDQSSGEASPITDSRTRSVRSASRDERWQTDLGRLDLLRGRLERCSQREDFQAELGDILLNSDKSEVARHLAVLFEVWLQVNPEDALRETANVEKLRHDFSKVSDAFFVWSQTNPDAAEKLLEESLDGRQLDATKDPAFVDGIDLPIFLLSTVVGLGTQNPEKVGDLLAKAKSSSFQESAFSLLMLNWVPAQPDLAFDWARSVESDETRSMLLELVAQKLAHREDFETDVERLQSLEQKADRLMALQAFVGQWSQRFAEGAYDWVQSLPDKESQLHLMPEVITQRLVSGEEEVTAWIDAQEAGPEMDSSLIAYSVALANLNPEEAMNRITSVTDAEQRDATYFILADRWSRRDAVSFQSYLQGLDEVPEILNSFVESN